MPNNASARREKDKKKKDKKQRRDPKPLQKEDDTSKLDKASMDTTSADSLSLSLPVTDKQEMEFSLALDRMEKAIQRNADAAQEEGTEWDWARTALLVDYSQAVTMEERLAKRKKLREEIRKANPLASEKERYSLLHKEKLMAALEWHRSSLQSKKDSLLSSSLAEQESQDGLLVRGPAQDALLAEFNLSLTDSDRFNLFQEVKDANPRANANELGKALRALKVQAALTWRRKKMHEAKESSLSLTGMVMPTKPLSLKAQPKSDMATKYYLSLTKEERTPVFEATKLANPDASSKVFNKAYKIALWKADSLKKGINPTQGWEAVDFSPVSDTYSEDSDQEGSTSSEDGMQVIRKDLLRQRQAISSTAENRYLARLMKSPDKPLPDAQAKLALDKDPFSLISPPKQTRCDAAAEDQAQRAGDSTGHGGSMSAHHGSPSLALSADAHLDGMQLAVDLIRAGSSSSSSSQPAEPIRNNSDVSLQVSVDKEAKPQAQRVLGEASCITRLKEIRELAGDLHLRDFTDGSNRDHRERQITRLFRRFLRENVDGDPPFSSFASLQPS